MRFMLPVAPQWCPTMVLGFGSIGLWGVGLMDFCARHLHAVVVQWVEKEKDKHIQSMH